MHLLQIIFVVSGFASGLSLALYPSPYDRDASHVAIWSSGVGIATYLLFLAVCANFPNYMAVLLSSLAAIGAGFACGAFLKHEAKAEKPTPVAHPLPVKQRDVHA